MIAAIASMRGSTTGVTHGKHLKQKQLLRGSRLYIMKWQAEMSEQYPAAFLCFAGIILHILLSDPLLNALGIHYSGEEGHFYEKIHPGTILIFISFFMWLARGFTPVEKAVALYRQQKIFCLLLALYVILFFYMAARSGFAGLAFIIDTHMT